MVVGENGSEEVKLMDFGIARLRDGGSTTQLTRSGLIMGTPAYMAPEQAEGTEVSEKTDIYALGIVLYEMLSGTVPFKASTPAAVLVKQIQEAPVPLRKLRRDLPAALERTIMQALEKQPTKRQKNADQVADQLRRLEEKLRTDGDAKGWASTTWNPFKKAGQEKTESTQNKDWRIGKTVLNDTPALPTQVAAEPYAATQVAYAATEVLDRDGRTVFVSKPPSAGVKWAIPSVAAIIIAALIGFGAYRYVSTRTPDIDTVAIVADKTNLAPRERLTLNVKATYTDKSVQPLLSGLAWKSSNDSVARVNEKGEVEGLQEGVVVITAQYGDHLSSSIDLAVKAIKPLAPSVPILASLTVSAPKRELKPNERTLLQLSGRYSDGTEKVLNLNNGVVWTISDERIALVDSRGRVTAKNSGDVQVSASYEGVTSPAIALIVKELPREIRPAPAVGERTKPPLAEKQPRPNIESSLKLANVYYDDGKYAEAIAELDQAIRKDPDSREARALKTKVQRAWEAEKRLGK
jgi:hypothetical protein